MKKYQYRYTHNNRRALKYLATHLKLVLELSGNRKAYAAGFVSGYIFGKADGRLEATCERRTI